MQLGDASTMQALRDEAKRRLDDAAACNDPAQRDALVQQALDMLAEARRLRRHDGTATSCLKGLP